MQQFLQNGEKEKNALVTSCLKIGITDEKKWSTIKIYLICRGEHPALTSSAVRFQF